MPIIVLVISYVTFCGKSRFVQFLNRFVGAFRVALTPISDQWTLETEDRQVFEETEVVELKGEVVKFQYKYGSGTIPFEALSSESRDKIVAGLA